jgi:hypothetical protein
MKSNYSQGNRSGVIAMVLTMLTTVVIVARAVPAQAQTPTTLHGFKDVSTDACEPENNIIQGRDGNMYGVGLYCGTNNTGAVYKISPTGAESVIFSFPSNWSFCFSGLTLGSDGNFYGTLLYDSGRQWQHFPVDACRSRLQVHLPKTAQASGGRRTDLLEARFWTTFVPMRRST